MLIKGAQASMCVQLLKHLGCLFYMLIALSTNATNMYWSAFVQVKACCRRTTSHYVNQCKPSTNIYWWWNRVLNTYIECFKLRCSDWYTMTGYSYSSSKSAGMTCSIWNVSAPSKMKHLEKLPCFAYMHPNREMLFLNHQDRMRHIWYIYIYHIRIWKTRP